MAHHKLKNKLTFCANKFYIGLWFQYKYQVFKLFWRPLAPLKIPSALVTRHDWGKKLQKLGRETNFGSSSVAVQVCVSVVAVVGAAEAVSSQSVAAAAASSARDSSSSSRGSQSSEREREEIGRFFQWWVAASVGEGEEEDDGRAASNEAAPSKEKLSLRLRCHITNGGR